MKYIIEKGVPIPKPRRYNEMPFFSMEIGDSFFHPVNDSLLWQEQSRIMQQANLWCRDNHPERKFVSRFDYGGIRIWRVK